MLFKNNYWTAVIIALFLLVSCSTSKKAARYIPGSGFLAHNEQPDTSYGATGYILIPKSMQTDSSRLLKIAETYRSMFYDVNSFDKITVKKKEILITYWLTYEHFTNQTAPSARQMIVNYDYYRASPIIAKLDLKESDGPFLIASRPDMLTFDEPEILVLKLAPYADDEIPRAFQVYKERLTSTGEPWDKRFTLEYFRAGLRNAAIYAGDNLLNVVWPKK
ncbi:hypothetical protein QTN47_16985 [Danxiaibacter flavus]|uniref:Lipoprotein n=1 Tax=Danxiaibacter flavus TaxID=3049108 RepID=A0ABV3ZH28_9BACT|nr:hypothetical protein QNM32_16995 [Chitinophagaceae bacterium DXS]